METREEYELRNLKDWEQKIKSIFSDLIPKKYEWTYKKDIINTLNCIGTTGNHMLLPTGGGLDLKAADIAIENGCIKVIFGDSFHIVKPKRLIFNSLGDDCSWDYFRLEIESLNPSGIYGSDILSFGSEELTYLSDGTYLDRAY